MSLLAHNIELRAATASNIRRRARVRAYVFVILGLSTLVLLAALIYNAQRAARDGHGSTGSGLSDDPSRTSDP